MADTQRTRAALLALMADNVTGQISAQDFRDFMVTVMEPEFVNPGDFWKQPDPKYNQTDPTCKGDKLYSQWVGSDVSAFNPCYMQKSTGYWERAIVADSDKTGVIGLPIDSYTSDTSTAVILLRGLVYYSAWSTLFSRLIGRPIYLGSTGSEGSITMAETTNSVYILGYVAFPSDTHGDSNSYGKFWFDPEWSIKGQ